MSGARGEKLEPSMQRLLAMRSEGWFRAHMDTYFEQAEEPRHDPGWFHPSSLDHPCDAFLAFQFLGVTQTTGHVTSRRRRIFDNGHSTEARWQEAIKRAGVAMIHKAEERRFEIPQYRIRGEVDNIIRHPVTNELFIWDCKTMREDFFDELKEPLPSWVTQMHCYMFGKGILQSQVTVECKNCQEYKDFVIRFDGQRWANIVERVTRIMERVANRQEIARTPIPNDSSCPFHSVCAGFDFRRTQ